MPPRGVTWLLLGLLTVLAARRWLDVVEVRGRSMAPSLLPGDRLLVVRAAPRPGDVVLAPDPRQPGRELIKRVSAVDARGVHLRGDNLTESTDARAFGSIALSAVEWRAVLRYWPPARLGLIPVARDLAPRERDVGVASTHPVDLAPGDR